MRGALSLFARKVSHDPEGVGAFVNELEYHAHPVSKNDLDANLECKQTHIEEKEESKQSYYELKAHGLVGNVLQNLVPERLFVPPNIQVVLNLILDLAKFFFEEAQNDEYNNDEHVERVASACVLEEPTFFLLDLFIGQV